MKIGIYNPYFDSLGGGERYSLTLASHWAKIHDVDIFWEDKDIAKKAQQRLKIDLSRTKVVPNLFRGKNILKKAYLSKKYDLIFFLSDGSVPLSLAKKNIIHFQSPFPFVGGQSIANKTKFRRYQAVVCNSQFTKKHIDQEFGVRSEVIYPPVGINEFRPLKKEKIILTVGRFTAYSTNKKQKEMVQFFKTLAKNLPLWEFRLVGGLLEQDKTYFQEVVKLTEGLSAYVFPNDPFAQLQDHYGRAMIYWHAAGFGEDEKKNPAAMEHFGITTVEAMAAGCIPIVYDGGGQPEIVRDGKNGFLWRTPTELIEKTMRVIKDEKLQDSIHGNAIVSAKDFDEQKFCEAFDALLASIT